MSFLKKKSKWGMVAFGIGTVCLDYNGLPVSTISNEYGSRLKIKLCGGYKLSDKPSDGGERKWLRQDLWCSIPEKHPLAPIVSSLNEGDVVFIIGKLKRSTYVNPNTGNEHKKTFCDLEDIQLRYHGNGDLPTAQEYENNSQDSDDTDDDIDF